MSNTNLAEIAKRMPLFAGLSDDERDVLLKDGKMRSFKRGENIFLHGDPIKSFYIVTDGVVQLMRETPDGQEVTTDIITTGRTMCKKEAFEASKRNHQLSGVAATDVILIEFPASWLKSAAMKNPALALNIITAISEYAHIVEVEAEHKSTMSATQQVACFLQRLCILNDYDPRSFELPYSKTLIASRLGMQLETFSRTLPKLAEHGIKVNGTHVEFFDADAIEEYVCGHCSIEGECATHQAVANKLNK